MRDSSVQTICLGRAPANIHDTSTPCGTPCQPLPHFHAWRSGAPSWWLRVYVARDEREKEPRGETRRARQRNGEQRARACRVETAWEAAAAAGAGARSASARPRACAAMLCARAQIVNLGLGPHPPVFHSSSCAFSYAPKKTKPPSVIQPTRGPMPAKSAPAPSSAAIVCSERSVPRPA